METMKETLDRLLELPGAQLDKITTPGGEVPILTVPNNRSTIDLTPFINSFEASLPEPRRRRGLFTAGSLTSLMIWSERNIDGPIGLKPIPDNMETPDDDAPPVVQEKMRQLTFFATGLETLGTKWANPDLSLRIIGNYSEPDKAAWHDFGGIYKFPVSSDWSHWAAGNNRPMTQKDFAKLIDDRAHEITEPITEGTEGTDYFIDETPPIAKQYLDAIAGKAAKPIDLIRLSRGLTINIKKKVKEARNPLTGEGGIEVMAEHANEQGERIAIPALFYIRVSIFIDSDPTLIPVRLRYWVDEQGDNASTKWQYELLRPDLFVRDTFLAALNTVAARGHTALMGTPDMPIIPARAPVMVVDDDGNPRQYQPSGSNSG